MLYRMLEMTFPPAKIIK